MKIQINEHVRFFVKDLNTGEVKPVVIGNSLNPEYEFWIEVNSLVNVTSYGDTQTTLLPLPPEEPPIIIMPASEA